MWLLIFLCAFACASVSVDASHESPNFRKCCPRNQSLIKYTEMDGGGGRYECIDRGSVETEYNISYPPLLMGDSVPVVYGMPEQCDELQMVQLTPPELHLRLNTASDQCYDRLLLEIIIGTSKPNIPKTVMLTCINNETEYFPNTKLTINNVRKCCPKGQSYDTTYHICRSSLLESSEEWLINRLNVSQNFIYEVDHELHCKYGEYGVELSEELFSLALVGSELTARKRSGDGGGRMIQGEWCIEREYESQGLVARGCTPDCATFGAFCVRKCCPLGQHYKTRRCNSPVSDCVPNEDDVLFDISYYMDPLKAEYDDIGDVLGIRSNLRCPNGKVMLNRTAEEDHHKLTHEGLLHSSLAINNDYCFEAVDNRHCPDGAVTVTATICFVRLLETKDFHVSFVVISISCVCLALTLVVYCALPELRNLHGRTLICHVSMMLLACSCLARVQYTRVEDMKICRMLGYGIYFGFVAAFAWLNVMCFDIWWTFGSVRTVQPLRKAGTERRRFLWYSLYAWSIAVLLTLVMFLLDRYPVAQFLDADIGKGVCWFGSIQNSQSDWAHYIYFVIPMGLVTFINLVLWGLTARHCARVKSEVHRLQAGSVGDRAKRRFRVDRAKYVLTGKLWVVMGAGWISELLSTLTSEPKWLWMIIDLFNELQGVFIFLILVFKPKLYYLIRKRLGLEKPDAQKNGTSSTTRTSSTFLSRTISTDERTNLRISQMNNVKQP